MTTDPRFTDIESEIVGSIAQTLEVEYVASDGLQWAESPFGWIKTRPARQIGAIGERIVSKWALSKDFTVERSLNSDADRIIAGHQIEIKLSTLWADDGLYKFQQIRNQEYEYVFCIGISPFNVNAWFIPKSELVATRPGLSHQHGGASGSDTMWLSVDPLAVHDWLKPFGGTLTKVQALILAAGKGEHVGKPLKD